MGVGDDDDKAPEDRDDAVDYEHEEPAPAEAVPVPARPPPPPIPAAYLEGVELPPPEEQKPKVGLADIARHVVHHILNPRFLS